MPNQDPRALRDAFGSFMTGVTVVTAVDDTGTPVGFTANSFSSVSLQPPLLLVCPAKSLSTFDTFTQGTHFCVNVLASSQQEISNTFASPIEDRFALVDWSKDLNGCPTFPDVLARFSCQRQAVHDAGDHAILIGEVVDFSASSGQGLGYSRGGYFDLELERAAQRSHDQTQVGVLLGHNNQLLLEEVDGKLQLPSVLIHEDDDAMQGIANHLQATHRVSARIGMVYSLFENEQRSAAYYRAQVQTAANTDLIAIKLDDLADKEFTHRSERSMVSRYIQESQTGNHRLYVGDQAKGQTHRIMGEE